MTRSLHRAAQRPFRLALLAACAAAALASAPAQAIGTVNWVDWTSWSPSGAIGVLTLGDEELSVTFAGEVFSGLPDAFPEPYWGPATTYRSAAVLNQPPSRDALFLAGGAPDLYTLSFSQVVGNPIFAIGSLGLTNASRSVNIGMRMEFQPPVQLQVLSNGPNYYAGGQWTPFSTVGATLGGLESSGTVRLNGSHQDVQWRSPTREETAGVLVGTYMFTVGVDCDGYRLEPNPMTQAAAVPAGCRAFNDRALSQQANLQVRGTLENMGSGSWVTHEVQVTSAGAVLNNGSLIVGEQRNFASFGNLSNSGALDVRGTLSVFFGGGFTNSGTVTVKGDNTFPTGGRLLVDAGGRLDSTGTLAVESGGRLDLRGELRSVGNLKVDGSTGLLQVASTGRLDLGGLATVVGGIDNAGVVSVQGGGTLLFNRPIDFAGSVPLLNNRNRLEVQAGGVLQVAGSDVGDLFGSTSVRNGSSGTLQIDGILQVQGTLQNAGQLNLGAGGQLVVDNGRFEQQAGGRLQSLGDVRAEGQGVLDFQGGTAVAQRVAVNDPSGRLLTQAGATLTVGVGGLHSQGTVVNRGTMVLEGFTARSDVVSLDNHGSFKLAVGAGLFIEQPLTNAGRFEVEGLLTLGTANVQQTDAGVFVNNGTVTSADNLIIFGGAIRGGGDYNVSTVTFGDITFEQTTDAGPGNSPGTLRVSGDLELVGRTTLTMEFSDHDGGDRLLVGGRLIGNDHVMQLVFSGPEAPGLDQIFDFLAVGAGAAENLQIVGPDEVRLDFVAGRITATGQAIQAVAFASRFAEALDAQRLDAQPLGAFLDRDLYLDHAILRPGAVVSNGGTLGLRNTGTAVLEVGSFFNLANASLLNNGRMEVHSFFFNDGLVKVRAGAQLVHHDLFSNRAGARTDVRGELLGEGDSRIVNDNSLFEVHGRVAGQTSYRQVGTEAHTVVNGRLDVPDVSILGGRISGRGQVVGQLLLEGGARLEPGPDVGDFHVDGQLVLQGGEIVIDLAADGLSDRLVVDGGVFLGSGLLRLRLAEGLVPTVGAHWTWLDMLNGGFLFEPTELPWLLEAALPGGGYTLLADNTGWHDTSGLLPDKLRAVREGGELRLEALAPVPEPASVVLWGAGLGGLLWVAMRRRRAM